MGRWSTFPPQQTKKPVTVTITDRNVDGRISVSELRKGLRETIGGDLFSVFWKSWQAANKTDTNHDGFISNEEMDVLKNYASGHWNIDLTVRIVDAHGRHINQGDLY